MFAGALCQETDCGDLLFVILLLSILVFLVAVLLAALFISGTWYLVSRWLLRRGRSPAVSHGIGVAAGVVPVLIVWLSMRSEVYTSDLVIAAVIVLPVTIATGALISRLRERSRQG